MYDFHTHTFLSDGVLSPIELVRRAWAQGYRVMAITDHVGLGNMEYVIKTLERDCQLASSRWDILALPGVELTHIPKEDIDLAAKEAKALGAKVVVVHGETIVEPVEPGTNHMAVSSTSVDILGHPGLVTLEDARLALEQGVYLEISGRRGHSLTNGHVAQIALEVGCGVVLDSDAHEPEDLLTPELAKKIAQGAGFSLEETHALLESYPRKLLARLGINT